jgi:hypothetical protein
MRQSGQCVTLSPLFEKRCVDVARAGDVDLNAMIAQFTHQVRAKDWTAALTAL